MTIEKKAQIEFFRSATHYYISGRFSLISQLFPVGANLLHHAVEMYIKGALLSDLRLKDIRTYNHSIQKLWGEFKTIFPDPSLNQFDTFDTTVERLDKFEHLRYPDDYLQKDMSGQFALFRNDLVQSQNTGISMPPNYDLILEDVDHLVKIIFEKASVNPGFYIQGINEQAKHFLLLHNVHPLLSNT
jgi:HEPN domain